MRLGLGLACLVLMAGCTQAPVSRPPVVDASWRANEDDRVTKSPRVISVPTPDIQREKGERNEVTPIDPVAKIEPIDQPEQQTEIPPAVLSLLEQADELRSAGDFAGASARLERAQRIAPTEPEVYFQLSSLRLEQGSLEDAVSIATQGVDLAGSDQAMKRDLYTVIARSKDALGDAAGAAEARQLARAAGS
ncbi:MAG: tetratricopeptide repeat protein [Litorivicinaceae bacterium]|jgi:tetratricopeptide (TPR) repeat protein